MKGLVGAFNQEKVGGLLRDYEPTCGPSFEALVESGVIYSFHLQCEVGGPVVAQVAQCHQTVYSPDKWKDWQNVSFTSHYTGQTWYQDLCCAAQPPSRQLPDSFSTSVQFSGCVRRAEEIALVASKLPTFLHPKLFLMTSLWRLLYIFKK